MIASACAKMMVTIMNIITPDSPIVVILKLTNKHVIASIAAGGLLSLTCCMLW
jgi:hypothetical protein